MRLRGHHQAQSEANRICLPDRSPRIRRHNRGGYAALRRPPSQWL